MPISLALLITACSGEPVPPTYGLKVNVGGVDQAKVTVTDTTSKQVVFADTITGSKTLTDLPKDAVFTVEGAAVNGFQTPRVQTVTLSSDKETTLTYVPQPKPVTYTLTVTVAGTASSNVTVTNQTTGTTLFSGEVTGSKTFADLPKDTLLKVEGAAVTGFAAPVPQTVRLTENQTVTLTYFRQLPLPATRTLTARVDGVPSAKVTVTDKASSAVLFTGDVSGSKAIPDLPDDATVVVTGSEVGGFVTPAPQTIQLSADKTVGLTYVAVSKPTYALNILVSGSFANSPKIKVTNKATGEVLLESASSRDRTIEKIAAGTVVLIEGAPAEGNVTPKPITVEITGNTDVALNYVTPRFNAANSRLAPGTTVNLDLTVQFADFDFKEVGEVKASLTVTGLPAEVSVKPQDVVITSKSTFVSLPLTAAATTSAGIQTYTAQVVATSEGHVIGRQPVYVTVLPRPVTAPELGGNGYENNVVAPSGDYWYQGFGQTVYQVNRGGAVNALTTQASVSSSRAISGEDGLIYFARQGNVVQIDPRTGQQKTGGLVNPKTTASFIDAKGRGWESYFGIYRNDYQYCENCNFTNTPVVVPGSEGSGGSYSYDLIGVTGNTVWMRSYLPGKSRLIRMDGDSLEQTTFAELTEFFSNKMFARSSGIWLSNYGQGNPSGGALARVNPNTGEVTTFKVVVDGAEVKAYETYGVTDDGRYLLLVSATTAFDQNADQYVLYNPITQTVEKRLVIGGSGSSRSLVPLVNGAGQIWMRSTGLGDLPADNLYPF